MPLQSALARIQQVFTIALIAGAAAWLAWHWERSPVVAVAGFCLIAFGYALFLGAEFVALYFVSRRDTTPPPGVLDLVRAWAGEAVSAPRVFCWRQPFRWAEIPDEVAGAHLAGKRGVVFIHGFVCNRGLWNPWLRVLQARGHAFAAVNLEPVFASIDSYAPTIDDAVRRVAAASGLPPVLACHSMGGLAARAWLRRAGAQAQVAHVITIGSPHQGTWLAGFSHFANGRQMRLRSSWLGELAMPENGAPPFTCWYSNCDNIVFPTSSATLHGADNKLVRGVAHVDLAFDAQVMDGSLAVITS